jgi:hypothetical protein
MVGVWWRGNLKGERAVGFVGSGRKGKNWMGSAIGKGCCWKR